MRLFVLYGIDPEQRCAGRNEGREAKPHTKRLQDILSRRSSTTDTL
jgi:hypothetical protein